MASPRKESPFIYQWLPGCGPLEDALESLQDWQPKPPRVPPGEAWFMGEHRLLYTEFLDRPFLEVPTRTVEHFLFELTSGIECFKEATDAVDNWKGWFRHLLPQLILRAGDEYAFHFLLEAVITASFRVFGDGRQGTYKHFRTDILNTLGRVIMAPGAWDKEGESLFAIGQGWEQSSPNPQCGGAISASLVLCLVYLEAPEISTWVKSILQIKSQHFRTHFLCWLAGSYEPLVSSPTPFVAFGKPIIELDWQNRFLLEKSPPIIPQANITEFFECIRRELSFERLCGWLEEITIEELSTGLSLVRVPDFIADRILNPSQ